MHESLEVCSLKTASREWFNSRKTNQKLNVNLLDKAKSLAQMVGNYLFGPVSAPALALA